MQRVIGAWSLMFLWSLELGIWSFAFSYASSHRALLPSSAHNLASAFATAQKIRQRQFQRTIRRGAMKRNPQAPANILHALAMSRQLALVLGPDGVGVQVKIALAFDILEQHRIMK